MKRGDLEVFLSCLRVFPYGTSQLIFFCYWKKYDWNLWTYVLIIRRTQFLKILCEHGSIGPQVFSYSLKWSARKATILRMFFFKWTNISYYFEYYYLLVKRCTIFSCILRLCTGCCEDVITKNSRITKIGARNLGHIFQKLFWFRLFLTLIWLLFYLVLCIQLSLTSDYFPVNINFPYFENTSRHTLCTSK